MEVSFTWLCAPNCLLKVSDIFFFFKSLGPHISSLYFARKMGNIYSDLLKCANINVNTVDKAEKEFVQLQASGGTFYTSYLDVGCLFLHSVSHTASVCLGFADTNPWMTVSDCVFLCSKSAVVSLWALLKKLSRFQLSAFQILLRDGL